MHPVTQELVLIGGGHTHAIALRLLGMQPLSGVRITLISEAAESAYSGMIPGRIAGIYTDIDCHVNLSALADFAGAQFYVDRVIGLDLDQQQVLCDRHPPVAFDWVSIDIGSTPVPIPNCDPAANLLPAKPVRSFLDQWDALLETVSQQPDRPLQLAIVGGGAAGAELALTMQHRIQTILQAHQQPASQLTIHLLQRGAQLVPQFNASVRRILAKLFQERQIHVHLNAEVTAIADSTLRCQSGLELTCDAIVWVTQAAAPPWLATTGLALDDRGFIQVSDTLQSLSHPNVFAVGDIATMVNHPRPKAGVFAVRQGKPLVRNLRRACQQQPFIPFRPQTQYLSLINTADGQAIAARGRWGWRSPLLWRWKDRIDRRFMDQLNQLPAMPPVSSEPRSRMGQLALQPASSEVPAKMLCAGCGAKVGSGTLHRVLQRLPISSTRHPPDGKPDQDRADAPVLVGLSSPDDAAVIQVPSDRLLVQTVDFLPALLADPFVVGQITANHALSDVYAMGALPHSALAIATIPSGSEKMVEETLYQLLAGVLEGLQAAGAQLIGGHTIEGHELALGLTCNGWVETANVWRKGGMSPGQALILTKPLGTGTLFAAKMRAQALGRWIDAAVASMLRSPAAAAQCFRQHGVTACTDVTGFGLVGHLREMVQAAGVDVQLELETIPALPGALTTLERGIVSSLQAQNLRSRACLTPASLQWEPHPQFQLLFDPQTAGGLLAAIPMAQAAACVAQLQALGYEQSQIIGYTQMQRSSQPQIAIV